MRSKLGDKARLMHILEAIHEIEHYTSKVDFDAFGQNSMMRFATIKQMEIIGEASNHLSQAIKEEFSTIAWSQIIGLGNVFVHEYFGVDTNLVWEIIKNDLPELKAKIAFILKAVG